MSKSCPTSHQTPINALQLIPPEHKTRTAFSALTHSIPLHQLPHMAKIQHSNYMESCNKSIASSVVRGFACLLSTVLKVICCASMELDAVASEIG